ncbi:MAG TPA: NAD-dependent deacetylase [Pseudogracilibacillus sp.]|nr:NAD-dependent deacetylase [Pseudogracilibacillus sp.]
MAYWQTLKKDNLTQTEGLYELIKEAEAVVLGVGAGLSAADGFTYIGKRFNQAFPDFIEKYHLLDMLQASLYEYESLEEFWAFQSRFIIMNYFDQPVGQSYVHLKNILANKAFHVITTNADNGFHVSGIDMDKVFRIQGEYGLMQCIDHCHQQTYKDESLIRQMAAVQEDMQIPSDMIPYCPQCSAALEVNKRTEEKGMVEDEDFHAQKARYEQFLHDHQESKVLYLEIGVGHTTPQFIKHPFQKMTAENERALFVTMNAKDYYIPHEIRSQTIRITEDIAAVIDGVAQLHRKGE